MDQQALLGVSVLIFLGVSIMIAVIIVGLYITEATHVTSTLRKIANAQNGRVIGKGTRASVYFKQRGIEFSVTGKTVKGAALLTIRTHWPDPSFRAKFFPETISDAMKNFIGMQDIKVGNKEFDDRFVIQSNNVAGLIGFLTPTNHEAIHILGSEAVLNISGGTIQLERKLPSFSHAVPANSIVSRFVKSYFILRDGATNLDGAVTVKAVSVDTQCALCMVCGDQIVDQQVFCHSCDTPHHQECWTYLGQCSTYGCGEKRMKAARSKSGRFNIR